MKAKAGGLRPLFVYWRAGCRAGRQVLARPALALVITVTCVMAGYGQTAQAQRSNALNPDFEETKWEEQKTQLPAYPKDAELVEVDVGPITSFRFFVDPNSVDVGKDGVVRFTLVARSQAGASNVSFEGIRCQTRERKMYAVGRSDGIWSQARDPRWNKMERPQLNTVHMVLLEDYFCPQRNIVANTREAADAIRSNGHPRGRSRIR